MVEVIQSSACTMLSFVVLGGAGRGHLFSGAAPALSRPFFLFNFDAFPRFYTEMWKWKFPYVLFCWLLCFAFQTKKMNTNSLDWVTVKTIAVYFTTTQWAWRCIEPFGESKGNVLNWLQNSEINKYTYLWLASEILKAYSPVQLSELSWGILRLHECSEFCNACSDE